MLTYVFPSGPFTTNAYVVACPKTRAAAVIDPAPSSHKFLIECLEQNRLELHAIYLTHSHWDHIADIPALLKYRVVPVYAHPDDLPNLLEPGSDGLPMPPMPSITALGHLTDGYAFAIGSCMGKIIHTPGHTPGSVCLFFPDEGLLYSGDTLFKGSIGNLSFPTSQPEKMENSLNKLSTLPLSTKIYPGHGPKTSLAEEMKWLPRAKQLFGF